MFEERDIGVLTYLREEVRLNENFVTEIRDNQADALKAYDGKGSKAALIEGGSEVVSRDVFEAVEAVVPNIVNIFKSGKQIFEFNPVSADDVEKCKQENRFLRQELDRIGIYNVIDTAVRDAAIQKNGYAKVYWEQNIEKVTEKYEDKTIAELQMILSESGLEEDDVKVVSKEVVTEVDGVALEEPKYNVELELSKHKNGARIENVASENLYVDRLHTSQDLSGVRFIAEKMVKTASELIAEGYDKEKIAKIPTSSGSFYDDEFIERYGGNNDGGEAYKDNRKPYNDAGRIVYLWEIYARFDYDEDGVEEYRRLIVGGESLSIILENEEVEDNPYICGVIQPQGHEHYGKSIYDVVSDIQEIMTHFQRQVMDNTSLANNPRFAVRAANVNLDDLMNGTIDSPVRVQGGVPLSDAIQPFSLPFIGGQVLPVLDYFEGRKEGRLGVNKQTQGLDSEALKGQTMFGVKEILSQSLLRSKYYAGNFGESFVKKLVLKLHKLFRQYGSGELYLRTHNEFHPINPREWVERKDLTLNVGVGVNSNEDNAIVISKVLELQEKGIALQGSVDNPNMPVTIDGIYNAIEDLLEYQGLTGVSKYFNKPNLKAIIAEKAQDGAEQPSAALSLAMEELNLKRQSESEKLDLEAEKIGREYAIKEREQDRKDRELYLKEMEVYSRV